MRARKNGLTYAQAGVDIDAGNAMVERIKPLLRATRRPGGLPRRRTARSCIARRATRACCSRFTCRRTTRRWLPSCFTIRAARISSAHPAAGRAVTGPTSIRRSRRRPVAQPAHSTREPAQAGKRRTAAAGPPCEPDNRCPAYCANSAANSVANSAAPRPSRPSRRLRAHQLRRLRGNGRRGRDAAALPAVGTQHVHGAPAPGHRAGAAGGGA